MGDNLINEPSKYDLEMVESYRQENKLAADFFPLVTYDLVQTGYPTPTHGVMVGRAYGGTNDAGELLSGTGEFCKVEDVRALLSRLIPTTADGE